MDNKFNRNSLLHKVPNLHNFPPRNLNSIAILLLLFFLQKRHNKLTVTPVICDVLTFQWQVNCWRTDRQHQRHVSRLRYPLPSSDYLSARFARQLFFFFHPRRLFSPFSRNAEPGPRRFFLSMEINCIKCPEKRFKTSTEFVSRTDLLQKTHLRWQKLKHLR